MLPSVNSTLLTRRWLVLSFVRHLGPVALATPSPSAAVSPFVPVSSLHLLRIVFVL